jgi:hypothetical protein
MPVLVRVVSGDERLQVLEDGIGSLEPLAVSVRQEWDLVLALAILRAWGDLPRNVIDAELRQPFADGGRVWAPLRLVELQHVV